MNDLNLNILKLEDIATPLFGMKPEVARRKAALGLLPVPAFRLNESRKGPFFVHKDDVDALVTKRLEGAAGVTQAMLRVTQE